MAMKLFEISQDSNNLNQKISMKLSANSNLKAGTAAAAY